ncbi:hypothetical protein pv_139 [Pithovirus sibericum]|uniref:Uncharacterized protein n=1 Tax=Pithovirus sibericum TaxID=1450746 RepID=W5S4R0_9VIRU|nr:hypothetical protein pv_139 [Pithovirus sibericum]AHH01706.1 hypothetical protein pv_139 [Pithovirus sibericum]
MGEKIENLACEYLFTSQIFDFFLKEINLSLGLFEKNLNVISGSYLNGNKQSLKFVSKL